MKVLTVVGARPQFVKAAAVSRLLRERHAEVLVHTGQHYDDAMSAVFFRELNIPDPEYHLGVGSGRHGEQTGTMLREIERVLLDERPDWMLVYGDTNSTLAGALAAAKLSIPLAHVEAGLRSFNRAMPEEINRVLTDHVATLLLCPSDVAVRNLAAEGVTRGVHVVGDVMADVLLDARARAERSSDATARAGMERGGYALVTVHRAENTDSETRLRAILSALDALPLPVVFPVHPRTRGAIQRLGYSPAPHVRLIEPLGYLDIVRLQGDARVILTDSGGVQKEAYWLGVPCVTLRDETEWVETVDAGWNTLVGADHERIVRAVRDLAPPAERPALYGDGNSAAKVVALLGAADVTRHLVTGGAGFIGSHLVRRLLDDGHSVRVVDDLSTGSLDNLEEIRGSIDVVVGDLADPSVAARAVDGVEVAYHLAALGSVPRSLADPWRSHVANVDATVRLLVAAREAGVRRVIYSSSSSVYGDTPVLPKHEEVELLPRSPYAASKLSGEQYVLGFGRAGLLEAVALRYFNVFGPRQNPAGPYAAVIPVFFDAALRGRTAAVNGDGTQTRDFTYVENVVEANRLAATGPAERVNGQVVNCGAGGRTSLLELLALVQEVSGRPIRIEHRPPRAGDVRDSLADLRRAHEVLGYAPHVSLREGLERTWAWFVAEASATAAGGRGTTT